MKHAYVIMMCTAALLETTFAAPVDIMIGARGYGLGGAYSGLASDASAAYWNPAGLSCVKSMTIMESNWIFQEVSDFNINYLTLAVPVKLIGTVSGSWLYEYARLAAGPDDEITAAGEHIFSLSIGRSLLSNARFLEDLSVGFTINRHTFLTSSGNGAGLGFDLGSLARFAYGISFAVVGRNIGADMMGDRIDPELRTGIAWTSLFDDMHRASVSVDGLYKMNRDYINEETMEPARNNMKVFGGVEYAILLQGWEIAIRGGGNGSLYNALETYGWAAGMGISYRGYSFQYAFKGDTNREAGLGFSHRVEMSLEPGNLRARRK